MDPSSYRIGTKTNSAPRATKEDTDMASQAYVTPFRTHKHTPPKLCTTTGLHRGIRTECAKRDTVPNNYLPEINLAWPYNMYSSVNY